MSYNGARPKEKCKPEYKNDGNLDSQIEESYRSIEEGTKLSYNEANKKEKNRTRYSRDRHMKIQNVETKRRISQESSGFYRHLSVRLYDVLDSVGASAEFRDLRQDCAISAEIISTVIFNLPSPSYSCYIFGSSSEGTTTQGLNSDTDCLYCSHTIVVDNISKSGDGRSLLMICDEHTPPGYVKLQAVYNGQPQTVYTRVTDPEKEGFDSVGKICRKHRSMLGKDMKIVERNGPADTSTKTNMDFVHGTDVHLYQSSLENG